MKLPLGSSTNYSLYDVLDDLVNDRFGVIGQIQEYPREAGTPAFFHFYARSCNTSAFSRHKNFGNAGGASADRSIALAKAAGEAVERYCSAIYEEEELPFTSFEAASFPCIAPEEFALYSQKQYQEPKFPYRPFDPDTVVRWTPARDLLTNETCYVPAAMVFLPYYFNNECGENAIVQPISTGLACHSSWEEASLSGICEVIERDAFTIAWQGFLKRPQIFLESLNEENQDLVKRFECSGNSVTLWDITMDTGVPIIMGALRNSHSEAPALVVAASADLNPKRAVRKCLEELAHTRRLCQSLKFTMPPIPPGPEYENIKHQDDHIRFYCDWQNVQLADFLFQSEERRDFHEIENLDSGNRRQDLNVLLKSIESLEHRVLLADITSSDIAQLGLSVVRAIVPGFHPLCMGHKFRALGGSRLREVPHKLGYGAIRENPAPHPFP